MMNKDVTSLNKAEWKIYTYLKERTIEGKWTTQQEIMDYLNNEGINVTNKRTIRRYIQNIRRCEIIQKVILTSYSKGYIIMSEEQQFEILLKRKNAILKSLKQYYRDKKRLSLDNQTKLTFDTKERDFIESLLRG